jgi:hypothetical protein
MKIQKISLKNIKNKAVRNKSKIMNKKKIYIGGVGEEPKWHGDLQYKNNCENKLHFGIRNFNTVLEIDSRLTVVDDEDIEALKLLNFLYEFEFFKNECEEFFKYYIDWQNWNIDRQLSELEDELQSLIAKERLIEKKGPLTQADRIKIKKTVELTQWLPDIKSRIEHLSSLIKDIQMGKRDFHYKDVDGSPIIKYYYKKDLPNLNIQLEEEQKKYDSIMSQIDSDVDPFEVLSTYKLQQNIKDRQGKIRNKIKEKIKLNKKYKDGTRRTAIGIINKWATKFKPEVFNLLPGQTLIELMNERSLKAPQIMEMILQSEEYAQKIKDEGLEGENDYDWRDLMSRY